MTGLVYTRIDVKFGSGSWQQIKGSGADDFVVFDHPWSSSGTKSMEMRVWDERGDRNDHAYNVYVVPAADGGFYNAGNRMILWDNGDDTLDDPFLVVEGFDPTNENNANLYFQKGKILFDEGRALGQDMIVLNFAEGGADLASNAQVLEDAIDYVDNIKSGSTPIKLAGVSMGGVIARYALAEAEESGNPLNVSHFASIDAPQQGAVFDEELQDYLKSKGQGSESLESQAAKQLLQYNAFDPDGGTSSSVHNQFYNNLDGLDGDGYPEDCKTIGVAFAPNTPNPNSGKWLEVDADYWLGSMTRQEFYISSGEPIKEAGSLLPSSTTQKWGAATYPNWLGWNYVRFELDRITHPTFIPHESALDLNWSGNTKFDVPIFSDTPGFHDEVPQDIVSPLLQEMDVGTPTFPPNAPKNFTVTSEFSNYYDHPVRMEWDMVSSAEKYYVYRCRAYSTVGSCYNSWTHLLTSYGTSATDTQFYMDDGSSGDGAAMYRVRAVNLAGTSDPSNVEAIWVKDPSTTTYSKLADKETDLLHIPEEIALEQSMPNPARGSVTIPVALPETVDISLVLYDITGREVAHLSDGQRPAGFYKVHFDTSILPSGVYLYRLEAGNYTETRRMTIVR